MSSLIAVGAGAVAASASGIYSWVALSINAVGFAVLVAGVLRGRERAVTVGAAVLFAGTLVAGIQGTPAGPLLAAVTAAVVAWDAGGTAISVGKQLGRTATTVRIEAVHAAAGATVGIVAAGLGYGLFRTATGGQPLTALVFLLVSAVLLTWALTVD